ncbi:hypothetical protein [Mucilaginibacter sp.]|uniref:hypothetical protein n=1 Tax=Mucilaginibacter sp. TaxID=1882438 RepID=UPI00262AC5F3|nr:hypothetical protein [Mucilaginibacter sp.]MDB4925293.1 hypothetical protein [Mucilaginibacter sp.]
MKELTSLLFIITIFFFAACKKDAINGNNNANSRKTDTLQGFITADRTLDANKDYFLKGQVYVKNNAILTIPAGITVYAEKNDQAQAKSVLVITKGAKINVNGTSDKPVVFTSAAAVKAPGDWGAIVLLGNAPTNTGTGNVAGLPISNDTQYGGNNSNDVSGSITFLRIEYTGGINPPAEDEWAVDKASGLLLASVGSGTKIDNVMVEHSNDDGFQFVGGTVNATHLIAYNNGDDDFDFDLGYQGSLQYLISYRTVASSQALRANGFESYNDEVPTTNTPLTRPVVSNMTIIGPQGIETVKTNLNQGVYMRKGTRLAIRNSIIAEYPQGAFMVCPRTRPAILNNDNAEFRSNLVQADSTNRTFSWDKDYGVFPDPELTIFETNAVNKNTVIVLSADLKLKAMYATGAPDLSPADGSPALSGADFTGTDFSKSFFTSVSYRGAIGNVNWAAESNWAKWK